MATSRLYAFPLTGLRTAVNSPERLAEARRQVASEPFPNTMEIRQKNGGQKNEDNAGTLTNANYH